MTPRLFFLSPRLSQQPRPLPGGALYRKWRPQRFADVIGQEHVTRTLRNAVKLDRLAHAYLLTGPRGTGKTSVARILYRAANCLNVDEGEPCNTCAICVAASENRALDLVEIDAASNRGIDDIRDLRDKVHFRPGDGRYRLYIIDEAHELTAYAWDAFLKTLEEPPAHAIFVLATTEAHAVPSTIVSRCQRFDLRRIPFDATREQLARVAEAEGMQVEPVVLERLARVARGGLRDALSLLDQLGAFAPTNQVNMAVARAALSLPSVEAVRGVVDGLARRDAGAVMRELSEVFEGGADLRMFVEELITSLRAVLIIRTGADARLTDELPAEEVAYLRERAPAFSIGPLIALVQEMSNSLARTRDAQQFQVQVELALLTAADIASSPTPPVPDSSAAPSLPSRERPDPPAPPRQSSRMSNSQGEALLDAPARDDADQHPSAAPESAAAHTGEVSVTTPQPSAGSPSINVDAAITLALAQDRWPDVVDFVKSKKVFLSANLTNAHPISIADGTFIIGFDNDASCRRADGHVNRKVIEEALKHVFGRQFRVRCAVTRNEDGSPSLLDDPVIGFAARTFGGRPRHLSAETG